MEAAAAAAAAGGEGDRDRDRNGRRYSGGGGGGGSSSSSSSRLQLTASHFIRSPVSALLEYSGLLRPTPSRGAASHESDSLLPPTATSSPSSHIHHHDSSSPNGSGEVSIRIIGAAEQDHDRLDPAHAPSLLPCPTDASLPPPTAPSDAQEADRPASDTHTGSTSTTTTTTDAELADGAPSNNRDAAAYQRYDIQQAARWIEQILPFSVLLLVLFIRQHLQGFCVTIWIAIFMFKSNDILRKQTALKGERKIPVLVGICVLFTLHVAGFYWWYRHDDLLFPLIMLPPKEIPPFWHAVFIIMVNDTLVRQAAMIAKCILLMYYKNSRGRNYRRQGQMLTLVEYLLLLYRALLPTPVWYRFFLNKEYGSLFSSLMTGLYLTFKLTSVVEKVQSFFAAVKALSRKEIHYGAYATSEQVTAAGDMCAICQEKMHTPILLRCKHIFCEDCVSEWFERERTCPLCRALVKPADLKSFGDGSTSLFFQLF